MRVPLLGAAALLLIAVFAGPAFTQSVVTEEVEGVRNFRRIGTTIACAGAITTDAVPEIARMGFASIINLRLAEEPGNDVEGARAAAETAGVNYIHIPWDGSDNFDVFTQFLDAMEQSGVEPAFIHCAGGGRAATMWMIKRISLDHWDVRQAEEEAIALGAGNPERRRFAIRFAQANHRM
jgi:uncharacterized protein (TIGR01244 family)